MNAVVFIINCQNPISLQIVKILIYQISVTYAPPKVLINTKAFTLNSDQNILAYVIKAQGCSMHTFAMV